MEVRDTDAEKRRGRGDLGWGSHLRIARGRVLTSPGGVKPHHLGVLTTRRRQMKFHRQIDSVE